MQTRSLVRGALLVASIVSLWLSPLAGQDQHRFNFSAGAGVSFPNKDSSRNFQTGWNLDFRGGVNITGNVLADLDFTYNRWDLTRTALANFGQPGGYADVWAFSFTPVIRMAPRAKITPTLWPARASITAGSR